MTGKVIPKLCGSEQYRLEGKVEELVNLSSSTLH